MAAPDDALREEKGGEELEGEDDLEQGNEEAPAVGGGVVEVGMVEVEEGEVGAGEVEGQERGEEG